MKNQEQKTKEIQSAWMLTLLEAAHKAFIKEIDGMEDKTMAYYTKMIGELYKEIIVKAIEINTK